MKNYEICRYAEKVGQIAVYVKPNCPHASMIKGHLVTTKNKCDKCKSCRKRPATVNPEFEKAVEEMMKNEQRNFVPCKTDR